MANLRIDIRFLSAINGARNNTSNCQSDLHEAEYYFFLGNCVVWTKCWNCIYRLTIVLMIIILLCYYYFSPIAHRTNNFLIMFVFFTENISCSYYCKCYNKGNNKIITIIVIIIIIINHHHKLFNIVIVVAIIIAKLYSHQEKGVKNFVRVDDKYFSPLKQHSIISHPSYRCYKNISIKINLLR